MPVSVTGHTILEALAGLTKPHAMHEKPGLLLAAGWRARFIQSHHDPELPTQPALGPHTRYSQGGCPWARVGKPWGLFLGWLLGAVIKAYGFAVRKF